MFTKPSTTRTSIKPSSILPHCGRSEEQLAALSSALSRVRPEGTKALYPRAPALGDSRKTSSALTAESWELCSNNPGAPPLQRRAVAAGFARVPDLALQAATP